MDGANTGHPCVTCEHWYDAWRRSHQEADIGCRTDRYRHCKATGEPLEYRQNDQWEKELADVECETGRQFYRGT